jgi:hypothetical protein
VNPAELYLKTNLSVQLHRATAVLALKNLDLTPDNIGRVGRRFPVNLITTEGVIRLTKKPCASKKIHNYGMLASQDFDGDIFGAHRKFGLIDNLSA